MKNLENEISISILKRKWVTLVIALVLMTLFFSTVAIAYILFNDDPREKLKLLLLIPVSGFMGYLCTKVIRAGKYMRNAMIVTDHVFTNNVAFFGKKEIMINDIYCIDDYLKKQFRVKLIKEDRSRFALINQLKGHDIYLSNYLVNQADLVKIATHLRTKINCRS